VKRALLLLLVVVGCGHKIEMMVPPPDGGTSMNVPDAGDGGAVDGGGPTFIAFDSDFAPFRTWMSFHKDAPDSGDVTNVHTMGPLTEYLSARPPHGSTEFPVGTIIVKVMENQTPQVIFAMAKRGGGYNDMGASGWEWFQIDEQPDVEILWRGLGPPGANTYGGDPSACNTCHVGAQANDCVASPELQLTHF
jgi:hypothetical protein